MAESVPQENKLSEPILKIQGQSPGTRQPNDTLGKYVSIK